MQRFVSIPFKNEDGLTHIHGVAKFSSAGVVLEFESKIIGLISKGVKEMRLSLDELRDVKFKKGFMKRWASIEIGLNNFAKIAEVHGSKGRIKLGVAKDDFEAARDAVERMQKDLAEYTAGLPPAPVSIASTFDASEDTTKDLRRKYDR